MTRSLAEDIERIAYELLVDEAAQGVRWCEPIEDAERHARWAAAHRDDGVVAFGIAGDEQRVGPEPFGRTVVQASGAPAALQAAIVADIEAWEGA